MPFAPTGVFEMIDTERRAVIAAGSVVLALTLACSAPGETPDTPENRAEIAGKLATLSVELGSFEDVLDRGADLAWTASADTLTLELGRELTEEEQAQVREVLRAVLGEFLTEELWKETVIRVYADEFTASELASILSFYDSPVGRKVLDLETALTEEVHDSLGDTLDARLDEFIERVDAELATKFDLPGEDAR